MVILKIKNYEENKKILRKMENVFKCYIYYKGFVISKTDDRSYKIIPH